jgi:hypothetical protein
LAGLIIERTIIHSENSGTTWRFWCRWIWGCFIGWFLGFFVGFVVAESLEGLMARGPAQSTLAYALLGIFVGTGVGLVQWRLLRQRLSNAALWVAASAFGMGIAGSVGYGAAVLVFGYSESLEDIDSTAAVLSWTMVAACGGLIVGLIQRQVLIGSREDLNRWVLASTLGWSLSFAAFGATGAMLITTDSISPVLGAVAFFLGLIAGGVILGAVTATTAGKLLRKHQANDPD